MATWEAPNVARPWPTSTQVEGLPPATRVPSPTPADTVAPPAAPADRPASPGWTRVERHGRKRRSAPPAPTAAARVPTTDTRAPTTAACVSTTTTRAPVRRQMRAQHTWPACTAGHPECQHVPVCVIQVRKAIPCSLEQREPGSCPYGAACYYQHDMSQVRAP